VPNGRIYIDNYCDIWSLTDLTTHVAPLPLPASDRARPLYAAMDRHDAERRTAVAGVTAHALDADKLAWSRIGEAIASLADLVTDLCQASAFCQTQPRRDLLCARLVESIDDQVDAAAWAIIEAAARAAIKAGA
jgi:hypothetical protein